ncbi:ubiquitinyl hydrolase 1 [Ranunculus cassubicifolius]
MSRAGTRKKNKRRKLENDSGVTSEILRKIHLTGDVKEDDIRQLYNIRKPVCSGCRVNCKDNPNCFCGLVPQSNGFRKTGLWQKSSDIVASLGPDPSEELRESLDRPAGLTNLGATCYANSILQCLYMNTSFREGVFSVENDLLDKLPVLNQLSRLFVQLRCSKRAFIDSEPFIKTLELDNGVQQDSHEFLTLLLSLLERSLGYSEIPKARTIVQDLFRGGVSNVTRCLKCGKESEASSKIEDFYELELNIKGLKNLHDSLEDYFSVEDLCGDNQYFCESCASRADARRCIKLRSLPAFLNFQLKRCVFLPKTTMKKKLTSVFSFPGQLNMGQILSQPAQSELIYNLSAVLIHKGTAVNSGHYVAHIKDERTGLWWEFDDERVTKLGTHPFGEGSSNSIAKSSQPVSTAKSSEQVNSVPNENHISNGQHKSLDYGELHHVETFSSADAYMLMYSLRHAKNQVSEYNSELLPFHLLEEMNRLNASFSKACEDYHTKKERELHNIKERKEEVKSVLSDAPVTSEEPFFWIATDWLCQWADSLTPPPLDNTSIQCLHGKVPVSKVRLMKRLSSGAWAMLTSKYGEGPTLTDSDFCTDCLVNGAKTTVRADDYRSTRVAMKRIAEDAFAGKLRDRTLYYVSKPWLSQWLRRKITDFPCDADLAPTASIKCPHGELLPEQAPGAKRVLVPERLWLFFVESANAVKPDDPEDSLAFPSNSETCAICSVELTEVAYLDDNVRATKIKEKQNHEKLLQEKKSALSPDSKYYLVPSLWLTKWKEYVNASGKNMSSFTKPENLDNEIDKLKCEKHSRLLERPPELHWKRGAIYQKASPTDKLAIISESDWKFFCEDWEGVEWDGISAEIELRNTGTVTEATGLSEQMPITDTDMIYGKRNDEINPILKTYPEVCKDCVGEKESHKLMEKLQYCNEDISVYFVPSNRDVPRFLLEPSGTTSESDRRISKRARKTAAGDCVSLTVSGSTLVHQLKLMIWESFNVVKENQILRKGKTVIEGDHVATLADVNIFPGDTLWVEDSQIYEHRDIADELSDQKMEIQPVEEGFRGTLLTSSISTQVL